MKSKRRQDVARPPESTEFALECNQVGLSTENCWAVEISLGVSDKQEISVNNSLFSLYLTLQYTTPFNGVVPCTIN